MSDLLVGTKDALVEYERMMSFVTLIIAIIIGLCLCCCGISLIVNDDSDDWVKTDSTIAKVDCTQNGDTYTCDLRVDYVVNNIPYKFIPITIQANSVASYAIGDTLKIEYEKSNNITIRLQSNTNPYVTSCSSLFLSLIIVGVAYANYYIKQQSEVAALLGTADDIAFATNTISTSFFDE